MSAAIAPVSFASLPSEAHPEHEQAFDREYWLSHCEGFRVESREGRLGFVEDVRPSAQPGGEPVLAVRAGALGRRLLLIPGEDVSFVLPRAECVYLVSSPHLVGSEPRPDH